MQVISLLRWTLHYDYKSWCSCLGIFLQFSFSVMPTTLLSQIIFLALCSNFRYFYIDGRKFVPKHKYMAVLFLKPQRHAFPCTCISAHLWKLMSLVTTEITSVKKLDIIFHSFCIHLETGFNARHRRFGKPCCLHLQGNDYILSQHYNVSQPRRPGLKNFIAMRASNLAFRMFIKIAT